VPKDLAEVISLDQMPRLFEKKLPSDLQWRMVDYIQTCVKDEIGIGKPISIHFYAPLDELTK
jgi:hypothetical protein